MNELKPTTEFEEIALLIEESRNRAFRKVNEDLVLLYFNVGKTVSERVLNGMWGDKTVEELSSFILDKFPGLSGFTRRGLYRMKQFYETYFSGSDCFKLWMETRSLVNPSNIVSPLATQVETVKNTDKKIVSPLATQFQNTENEHIKFVSSVLSKITWTNHLEILSGGKTAEEKMFYLLLSIKDKLSKFELRRQIKTASFERFTLAKNHREIVSSALTQFPKEVFKDPYIFEFLDLPDKHSESDLERALILNLQKFILEIGKGFSYMGNQYRIQVGNKDFYTDLLFYHRDLQCLVIFELKIQEFEPEFLGKLNFYLEALDRDVKRPHENKSIGVLLCKGKDNEVVEYAMARNMSPALIADYETKLIPKNILAKKLNQLAEILAKNKFD
jgi:predicted nuclease of restriction endonuclease-like (RecB) superfamily